MSVPYRRERLRDLMKRLIVEREEEPMTNDRLLRTLALAENERPHLEDPLYVPSPYVMREMWLASEALRSPADG